MEKKPSIDRVLFLISEILKEIEHPHGPGQKNLPAGMLAQLDMLERTIPIIKHHLEENFKEAHIDIESAKKQVLESPNTNPKDKQLLKRAMDIEKNARHFQLALSKAMERGKGRKKSKSPKESKERRKLFKPLGGDKTWIPL